MTLAFATDQMARGVSRKVNDNLGGLSLIPNGGAEVWGPQTSFPTPYFAAAGVEYAVMTDWVARRESAADSLTVDRETVIIDAEGGGASCRVVKNGANGSASVRYYLPPQMVAEWRGRTVTVRCKIWTSITDNIRLSIFDGVSTSSFGAASYAPGGVWTAHTVTKVISTSATVIYIAVEFINIVTGVPSVSGTVYFDNLSVVFGSTPSIYVPARQVDVSSLSPNALAQFLAVNNPIINGDMSYWQRGISFGVSNSAIPTFLADRWGAFNQCDASIAYIQGTLGDLPPIGPGVTTSSAPLQLVTTAVDATLTAGQFFDLYQSIEGYNFLPYAQKAFTVGFWVKNTLTGIHSLAARNASQNVSCVMEYTVNVAGVWEYKTVTFPPSPVVSAANGWNLTSGVGLTLTWGIAEATSFQTTPGTWQGGNFKTTPSAALNSYAAINSATFRLWGVTMGLGATIQPFWPRLAGHELLLCQRYCAVANPYGNVNGPIANGFASTTNGGRVAMPLPVPMRVTPAGATIIGNWLLYYSGLTVPITSMPYNVANDRMVELLPQVSGTPLTVGGGIVIMPNSDSNARVIVAAEM